ncbi:hypothetical protein GUJ93_ZPchr0008g13007 [Zizania palustris]|uniref:Uncharacterized protein n=1 Tax=Zizania palustris TaxID=103762 RepID=A0A8J5RKJ1_ZIZPA|nr:hypothetical protein GUJ93_ZPchr0008g13007 [Zizania palustris]
MTVWCGGARAVRQSFSGVCGDVERVAEEERGRFMGWFQEAWSYVRGHRRSTFIIGGAPSSSSLGRLFLGPTSMAFYRYYF